MDLSCHLSASLPKTNTYSLSSDGIYLSLFISPYNTYPNGFLLLSLRRSAEDLYLFSL